MLSEEGRMAEDAPLIGFLLMANLETTETRGREIYMINIVSRKA